MDAFEAIATKLDVREFASKKVPGEVKRKVLEAARLTASSRNSQHWRFILVQDRANLKRLAADSTSGKWVEGADFAVMILTDPTVNGNMIDAGRALQDMELAAWDSGVASGIYVGVVEDAVRRDYAIPDGLRVSAILGFGYPKRRIVGRKNRKPLEELVFPERYGERLQPSNLA
ncbi:MAG: nitroreductase family protein [Nitrososphaerota archaeon]|nr:nitroreductase family protein [Nitrososphaerota archaeon]MDG6967524.1 nitroreductase family protein [Nitrososphaerota archaeon]MDG6978931.1 nitroreductase family protein [Nitrososphaerota archaeon]MDG6981129.1 nitroreductase family protein [Nitrososphaerota archaeon]MDG7020765.1 nitroreductase family protein [Nitrososphaerota archaeon]